MITSFKVFNKTYSTSDLRKSYIQNILRNARNNSSRIYCQCKGILAPVPMSSCLRNGNYYLKTLKNQEHGSQCRYFKQSINTSNCNSKQAVIITENNGLNIKLGLDFNAISSPNKKTISTSKQSPQSTAKSHTTRSSTSLGAYLKYLYTMANLHYYRPDKNNSISHAFKIFYHIINNSESIIDDMPAKDVLFSLNPGFKNKDIPATKVKYPIIIGSIEYLVKHKSVYKLKIKGLDKPIYVNNDAYKNIDNSSSHRIFNDEKLEGYDIAILQVGRRYFKNESCILTCVGINFDILTLDKNLLTFDSYHEYSFGNYLVESKRDFIKDISYIDTKNFTPDYILRDTCPETYVEIWGMNTDDYLTRKQEKLNLYNEIENPLLEWEPTKEKNFPELPKKYS